MKNLFILIGLILTLSSEFSIAANNSKFSQKISINVTYHYGALNQFGKMNQATIQNVISLPVNQENWTVIGGSQSYAQQQKNQNVFILLGKVDKADEEKAKIKFLTVILNSANQLALEENIVIPYGEQKHVKFGQGKNDFQIDVSAKRDL